MAIRFKYDAAAVAIPQNEARQRFGQQLVLQQQKYANDQRQGMQDRMYDQQREYRRTAYQLQKDQTDRFVDNQRMQEQQKFAERMQKNSLDAQQQRDLQEAQRRSEMMAKQQEEQRVAQLKAQERADVEDAIKSGAIDQITASEIKKSWALDTRIDLNPEYDEAQRAEAHRENQWNRSKLQENRSQVPSDEDRLNANVKWRDPSGNYHKPDMQKYPNGVPEGWDVIDMNQGGGGTKGGAKQQQPQKLPEFVGDYYNNNPDALSKDTVAIESQLKDEIDDGKYKFTTEEEFDAEVDRRLGRNYNNMKRRRQSSPQAAAPAMPPQAGQPAVPPQAPAAQPLAMGMQDLEPTYNADGTTASPSNPRIPTPGKPVKFVDENGRDVVRKVGDDGSIWQWVGGSEREITLDELGNEGPPPPVVPISSEQEQSLSDQQALLEREKRLVMHAQVGQPATAPMRAYHQDGRIFEQSPDGNWREFKDAAKRPIQQADGSLWQQSPEDGAWRVVPPEIQPFRPEPFAMPPARPLQSDEEEGMSTFAPKAPGVMQQPTETLPVDQTGMQPPPLPNEQEILSELFPQEAPAVANQAKKQAPAKAQAVDPAKDMIGEALKTFESGTPEQQVELRKKMKSSPDGIASLMAEAANNNPDAIKALDLMEKSISLTDALRDKTKKGKSADTNAIIGELQTRRKLGEIDDKEYVSSVVSASGKSAKQFYEEIKNPPKKGLSLKGLDINDRFGRNEKSTLSAIWDEMGMFDSRSYVRAFQKQPTMDDVITHAAIKGKMSRKDAEEWVYNQILGRNYAEKVQLHFDSKLGGGADRRRETKQNEKSAAWKPN